MNAVIITLGCKVNQYESEYISEILENEGFAITQKPENADVCIVNSCTVTAESDRKVRQTLRHIKKLNPDCVTVLTGCFPQAFAEECKSIEAADIITGNRTNGIIPELIKGYKGKKIINITQHKTGDDFAYCRVSGFKKRTRASLKIEDGCNRFCSYCIIPFARGRVRSKPLKDIKTEAAELAKNGFKEIVLVGINLSAYSSEGKNIADAVKAAAEADGIKRVRLGSLEPDHITDEIIEELSKTDKFCPQFHISLQSGCDATLKRMNRHYTASEYKALCDKLRSVFPDCTLTTDIMVGFAGETEKDFKESLEFVKKISFEKVHVFPYSIRPGTRAATMDGQVNKAVKEKRAAEMAQAADGIRQNFLDNQVGKSLDVLVEEHTADGCVTGYTANYTPVKITAGNAPFGEIVKVKITGTESDRCTGIVE